ncbi:hypothetical protein HYC85_024262 [Camellia sinensis]|uniref:Uncharacterized protein n=1 Tax=Camellia sinensis TaxID=4442 RepID=A0A7J7GBU3_CAMSI|nr:hypothetical protein HYC85_024262 [Camellia sinensis]
MCYVIVPYCSNIRFERVDTDTYMSHWCDVEWVPIHILKGIKLHSNKWSLFRGID